MSFTNLKYSKNYIAANFFMKILEHLNVPRKDAWTSQIPGERTLFGQSQSTGIPVLSTLQSMIGTPLNSEVQLAISLSQLQPELVSVLCDECCRSQTLDIRKIADIRPNPDTALDACLVTHEFHANL